MQLMCKNEICAGRKNRLLTLLEVMPVPGDIKTNIVGLNHINVIYVMRHITFVRHASQTIQEIQCL